MLALIILVGSFLQSDSSKVLPQKSRIVIDSLESELVRAQDSIPVADLCIEIYKQYKFKQLLNFPKEYAYLVRSLNIYEKAGEKEKAAYVCNALAGFHYNRNQMDKAIHFWQYALDLYKQSGNEMRQGTIYNNLSIITPEPKKYEYLKKAIEIQQAYKDTIGLMSSIHNLGGWYFSKGNLAEAERYYLESIHLAEALKKASTQQAGYLWLGKVRQQQGRYEEAIQYIEKSISFNSMREEDDPNSVSAYQILAELYASINNYQEAYNFQRMLLQKKDTLYKEQQIRSILDMEARYETEKKEEQIETARKQRLYLTLVLIATGLGLTLIALLYIQARKNKRRIEDQNKALTGLNKTKDRFFGIIAHDLRNPLVALSGLFKLLYLYATTGELQKLKAFEEHTNKSISEVNHLLDNLLNWASSQTGALPYHPEPIDVKRLFDEQHALFNQSTLAKDIQLSISLDTDYCILGDRNGVSTILRNLISNAIKFTNEGGMISLSACQTTDGEITLTIADTGRGMDSQVVKTLFTRLQTSITQGTHGEKGTGLGILICQEFVALNKGSIEVTSEINKGTTFYVSLPAYQQ